MKNNFIVVPTSMADLETKQIVGSVFLNLETADRSKVSGISPRVVQRDERIETQLPLEKNKFNNPSYPNQEENKEDKRPIQATEIDTDGPSMQMAINAPSMFSSRNETSVPSGFSYRSANASSSAALPAATTRSDQTKESNSFLATVSRYPEYMRAEKRLMTFQTPVWQRFEKPDLTVFVDLGFFFTGREDLVRCYMCGIGLKDWVRNDAVLQEHVKHSPKCTYLLQKFGKSEVERIQAGISSGNLSTSTGSQLPYKIRSPQYQTMEARLASFKSFPGYIEIPHQQLAVAGLYFTGQGDLCRCFTCDGGLKDWSIGDDPCREHATYFPNCDYINQLKGRDYVKALQQTRQNSQSAGAAGGASQPMLEPETSTLLSMDRLHISSSDHSRSTVSQITGMGYSKRDVEAAKAELERKGDTNPSVQSIVNTILDMQDREKNSTAAADNDLEDLQAIAEENERLSQMVQCMLCVEEEPDILFLPCAHHRICHKCSENITHCPVCNNYIKEKVRTYRA
ncbi:baculoviral IAP repeat-containing protein 7-B-like isoform X2 [Mercenaria mercenaria]|uniref:baculoviral IAP repeat-containing protein 7-B-like isoform X2 n=1 Tax=Mercenaria mercenaria TaxID=6596 RepID=UPI001E1DC94E|nr:baculoviral IAP repeat-containing protein 7-B-like isoform X2 [Mercenaria mercenaria]